MIYIKRDENLIPEEIIAAANTASAQLELLSADKRKEFIKTKSSIWRAFSQYLAMMSHGKCWYSESPDPQSFFDVDHYRPKSEAKRSEVDVDVPGYEWLAFSWKNFRYAANRSNRISTNNETGDVEGKGTWFPLLDGSPKASWSNRCEANEHPVLLDPVVQSDVDLIDVDADGRMGPSRSALDSDKLRVTRSCQLYGLNLPAIREARQRLMREIIQMVEILDSMLIAAQTAKSLGMTGSGLRIAEQCALITAKTEARSPFSKAARAALISAGSPALCAD